MPPEISTDSDSSRNEKRAPWPQKLQRWENKTMYPLLGLAFLFLIVYATMVLAHQLSDTTVSVLGWVDISIWIIFAIEYLYRLSLAGKGRRLEYLASTPIEAATVLLPPARPLRLIRVIVFGFRVASHRSEILQRTRMSVIIFIAIGILMFVSSLAILDSEQYAEGSNITDFADALWWSFVTVTTVGYGDYFPVTLVGRLIAIALMVSGIGLFGFVAATLASWITEKLESFRESQGTIDKQQEQIIDDLAALKTDIAELKVLLTVQAQANNIPEIPKQRDK